LDVSPCTTSRISLMRWGYRDFTRRTHVRRPGYWSPDVQKCGTANASRIPRRTPRCILSGPRTEDSAAGEGQSAGVVALGVDIFDLTNYEAAAMLTSRGGPHD